MLICALHLVNKCWDKDNPRPCHEHLLLRLHTQQVEGMQVQNQQLEAIANLYELEVV